MLHILLGDPLTLPKRSLNEIMDMLLRFFGIIIE